MLNLYATRHGETIWNTQSRMQGLMDSPLTDLGLAQAARLARQLRNIPLARVWSSPAPRAIRTAEIVLSAQSRAVPLVVDERAGEMALGRLEGLTVEEANNLDEANLHAFFYEPLRFMPLGDGEDFRQVSDRMADFLDDMTRLAMAVENDDRDTHVLLISHNITLKALFALMEKRPLAMLRDGPPIQQATLYRAFWDDAWHIGLFKA